MSASPEHQAARLTSQLRRLELYSSLTAKDILTMNEDERYRTSTQYRLWSYTKEALADLRSATNQAAAERVKAAIERARASRATSANGDMSEPELNVAISKAASIDLNKEVNCLTVDEELKLIAFYCRQTLQLGDHLKVSTDVKATAVQYLKRFYITNSVMTYHPTSILKTALFFATKTENHYFRLTKFAEAIEKTTPADVLASEFLLTQGLRFTFDIRHPFRALEGAVMELQAIASDSSTTSPLPGVPGVKIPPELGNLSRRVREAHGKAREYLKTSSLLTDVYFHYTPSQIMFSSLLLADPSLTKFYISIKIPPNTALHTRLLSTLSSCAAILQTIPPSSLAAPSAEEMKYLKSLVKKLLKCQNPEMMDLIKLNERRKREGGEEGIDEQVKKKRRMKREKMEEDGEKLFGGLLEVKKEG